MRRSIDLLHIDGYHTWTPSRTTSRLAPEDEPPGVVLFHDINVREKEFGVWRPVGACQMATTRRFAFRHGHGLGVAWPSGRDLPKRPLGWLPRRRGVLSDCDPDVLCRLGAAVPLAYAAPTAAIRTCSRRRSRARCRLAARERNRCTALTRGDERFAAGEPVDYCGRRLG